MEYVEVFLLVAILYLNIRNQNSINIVNKNFKTMNELIARLNAATNKIAAKLAELANAENVTPEQKQELGNLVASLEKMGSDETNPIPEETV